MASMFKLRSLFLIVNCNIACLKYVLLTWCSFLKRDYFVSPIYIINQAIKPNHAREGEMNHGRVKNQARIDQRFWQESTSDLGTKRFKRGYKLTEYHFEERAHDYVS